VIKTAMLTPLCTSKEAALVSNPRLGIIIYGAKNIAKQDVVYCTFMASWILGCLKWQIVTCSAHAAWKTKLLKGHRHVQ